MIDGIKTKDIGIGNQTPLDWSLSVKENGGEIHGTKIAEYRGLKFISKKDKVFAKGSLHKYFNHGAHNYNDFHYTDLVNVVSDLKEKFGIDPANAHLENVEFGVNVRLPFPVERVLSNMILHKGEPFFRFSNVGNGAGIECKHAQFYIKIYDKGAQYGVGDNLLRVEVKVVKMAYFQSRNIDLNTLSDLLEPSILKALGEALVTIVKEILFTDYGLVSENDLPAKEQLMLANGSNPNYWTSLKPNSKEFTNGNSDREYRTHRKKYYRELDRFERLLEKRKSHVKNIVTDLTRDKFTDLLNVGSILACDEFNTLKKGTNLPTCKEQSAEQKTTLGTNLHRVYSVSLSPTENRQCLTCGKDIDHLKKGARFCSKKCKNDYTNPRLSPTNNLKTQKKKIERYPLLFPVEDFLTNEKKKLLTSKNSIYRQQY